MVWTRSRRTPKPRIRSRIGSDRTMTARLAARLAGDPPGVPDRPAAADDAVLGGDVGVDVLDDADRREAPQGAGDLAGDGDERGRRQSQDDVRCRAEGRESDGRAGVEGPVVAEAVEERALAAPGRGDAHDVDATSALGGRGGATVVVHLRGDRGDPVPARGEPLAQLGQELARGGAVRPVVLVEEGDVHCGGGHSERESARPTPGSASAGRVERAGAAARDGQPR
ncbi:MAG: hypothetical protein CVU56_27200 [Deltaproteobacteria bacterium HGW-Deltaproteobacteria-14]|nr:MAG: hypothetical protein CVU56_27200 [Deltaproteobacteria bacterium HGW-Deltaproteobacteria-14]